MQESIQAQNEDHPRLCGEKPPIIRLAYSALGSPPPMRGKVKGLSLMGGNPRITPAYAGKSWQAFKADTKPKDHPRLCGEKATALWAFSPLLGSPPPMRGKVGDSKTWKIGDKDHPRLCGEKVFQTSEKSTLAGSPPPMRGKVFWLLATLCQPGITPAYAGKSQNHRPTHLVQKDHPRLCGEKFMRWAMRRISNRITPAYAGKSSEDGSNAGAI